MSVPAASCNGYKGYLCFSSILFDVISIILFSSAATFAVISESVLIIVDLNSLICFKQLLRSSAKQNKICRQNCDLELYGIVAFYNRINTDKTCRKAVNNLFTMYSSVKERKASPLRGPNNKTFWTKKYYALKVKCKTTCNFEINQKVIVHCVYNSITVVPLITSFEWSLISPLP